MLLMDRQHAIGGARPLKRLSSAIGQIPRAKSRRSNGRVLVIDGRIEVGKSKVYRLTSGCWRVIPDLMTVKVILGREERRFATTGPAVPPPAIT